MIVRLEMKKYDMILAKKQQAYQRYCEVKLINMNILKEKKYYVLIKVEL